MFKDFEKLILSQFTIIQWLNSNILFLVDTVKRKWKNLFDAYRKARDRERDQENQGHLDHKYQLASFTMN